MSAAAHEPDAGAGSAARAAAAEPGARGGPQRIHAHVSGTVQGVGFRPFVFALAGELGLRGWVRNDARGVEIEIEGDEQALERFLKRLRAQAPLLARIEAVATRPLAPTGERGFRIVASHAAPQAPDPLVAPDTATCAECLRELRDPRDRRYRYPFVNCTNCGPRFTIVRAVPYDRARTTMAGFEMCAACRAEYEDPRDRRFHAQPNACPTCGPQVWLLDRDGAPHAAASARPRADGDAPGDAVAASAQVLAEGAIVAVKGIGGYHLACRADDPDVVAELRARKRRERRPFALMVADLRTAHALAEVGEAEAELLSSAARPIVLAARRPGAAVAPAVAPDVRELGLMLPYSPLHHVLLGDLAGHGVRALVLTSGNTSEEPIAHEDDDARERLRAIADAFLVHDRPIHVRTEDSVVRGVALGGRRRALMLRRARGYVPASLTLPRPTRRPLLACGAELKSTFALARGARVWVGPHVGDLRSWETLRSFRAAVAHFEALFAVAPRLVAHDLHPEYLSTRYAHERAEFGVELLGVQHHHAHLAAVLAEHGERGPAVGAIYDGAGYGADGTQWGGELLVGDLEGFERAGHLRPVRLPGGDAAAREPWRMACAWLAETTGAAAPEIPTALAGDVAPDRWRAVARIAAGALAAPLTTSAGRLCDAVAALCGFARAVAYEGQAAIELEALADPGEDGRYELPFEDGQLDARPTIAAVLDELDAGVPGPVVAARFHHALAAATAAACLRIARERGLSLVVLGGGVFQNRLLLEGVAARLDRAGLRVLAPERLPPGDGAISFGQAAIAAWRA
jgi:hydrogenase maturation protein HypF